MIFGRLFLSMSFIVLFWLNFEISFIIRERRCSVVSRITTLISIWMMRLLFVLRMNCLYFWWCVMSFLLKLVMFKLLMFIFLMLFVKCSVLGWGWLNLIFGKNLIVTLRFWMWWLGILVLDCILNGVRNRKLSFWYVSLRVSGYFYFLILNVRTTFEKFWICVRWLRICNKCVRVFLECMLYLWW